MDMAFLAYIRPSMGGNGEAGFTGRKNDRRDDQPCINEVGGFVMGLHSEMVCGMLNVKLL